IRGFAGSCGRRTYADEDVSLVALGGRIEGSSDVGAKGAPREECDEQLDCDSNCVSLPAAEGTDRTIGCGNGIGGRPTVLVERPSLVQWLTAAGVGEDSPHRDLTRRHVEHDWLRLVRNRDCD